MRAFEILTVARGAKPQAAKRGHVNRPVLALGLRRGTQTRLQYSGVMTASAQRYQRRQVSADPTMGVVTGMGTISIARATKPRSVNRAQTTRDTGSGPICMITLQKRLVCCQPRRQGTLKIAKVGAQRTVEGGQ